MLYMEHMRNKSSPKGVVRWDIVVGNKMTRLYITCLLDDYTAS